LFSGSNQGSGFSSNADEIEISTKALYRRHINPDREMILDGLKSIFKNIDDEIDPDFKDFEEEKALEQNINIPLDEKTLESQAQLKGSVGGVQSLLGNPQKEIR
jgi:nucleoid-associated protein YejK